MFQTENAEKVAARKVEIAKGVVAKLGSFSNDDGDGKKNVT